MRYCSRCVMPDSRDVSPIPVGYDQPHLMAADAYRLTQIPERDPTSRVLSAKLSYCRRGDLCRTVALTVRVATLALGVHVVVARGSKKKVAWINTGGVVAAMTDDHPGRYRAIGEFVRKAMGGQLVVSRFTGSPKGAIPATQPSPKPFPARISLTHLRPESRNRISAVPRIPASKRAVFPVHRGSRLPAHHAGTQ